MKSRKTETNGFGVFAKSLNLKIRLVFNPKSKRLRLLYFSFAEPLATT